MTVLDRPWSRHVFSAVVTAVCLVALVRADHPGAVKVPEYRPDTCIAGDKHKTEPTPEDDSYKTCLPWKDGACCSAEFTQQLDRDVVTDIDGFHWNRCGNFSPSCQRFFVEIECFYRCSPNTAHWEGTFNSSINHLPLCSDYCDAWYVACAEDLACAANWIFDWNTTDDGVNYCKADAQCSRFDQIYNDSRALCNTLWGPSFEYSTDVSTSPTRMCLVPWFNETDFNPNEAAVQRIFGVPNGATGALGFTRLLAVAAFTAFSVLTSMM